MINVIFIKENKNNEIDNYFNNLSLFDNNDKYTYDFIKLLNEQDFIEFVNIKESDNINFITKLINILFNYNSDKIFNTIDINYSDDYLLHIIYDDKLPKIDSNLNILSSILCHNEEYVFGKAIILCYSNYKKCYVNIDINLLADIISNYYYFYMVNYNIKNEKINILKKLNYSSYFINKNYKVISIEYNNYLTYFENDETFNILTLKTEIYSNYKLQNDILGIFKDINKDININLVKNIINIFNS